MGTAAVVAKKIMQLSKAEIAKRRLDEDGNLERFCSDCEEWWPADREFFYRQSRRGGRAPLHTYCIACYLERVKGYRLKRKQLAAAI